MESMPKELALQLHKIDREAAKILRLTNKMDMGETFTSEGSTISDPP